MGLLRTYTRPAGRKHAELRDGAAGAVVGGRALGDGLPEPDGLTDATVHIADKVQDEVMEELCTTWPSCPGHGPPLSIDDSEGVASWVCPAGPGVRIEVGTLGPGVQELP